MKLYQAIVQNDRLIKGAGWDAWMTVGEDEETKTRIRHVEHRQQRILALLPRGSGIDCGTTIDDVREDRIVLGTAFHHMDANGFYDGWTEHKVHVKYSLLLDDIVIDVKGRNRNDIKDYLADVYREALKQEFDWLN